MARLSIHFRFHFLVQYFSSSRSLLYKALSYVWPACFLLAAHISTKASDAKIARYQSWVINPDPHWQNKSAKMLVAVSVSVWVICLSRRTLTRGISGHSHLFIHPVKSPSNPPVLLEVNVHSKSTYEGGKVLESKDAWMRVDHVRTRESWTPGMCAWEQLSIRNWIMKRWPKT